MPAPSADGNAGEHAKCEHGTIDLGRLRATARFDRRSMKAQYMAETKPKDTLQLLVGPFYKTSLENARSAMSKQPSVCHTSLGCDIDWFVRRPVGGVLDSGSC